MIKGQSEIALQCSGKRWSESADVTVSLKGILDTRERRREMQQGELSHYKMPESFKAFCNIVSLTAAKTSRMFVVSVA